MIIVWLNYAIKLIYFFCFISESPPTPHKRKVGEDQTSAASKTFSDQMLSSLRGRYRGLKTTDGRFKCPLCSVMYKFQPSMRKHIERVHLGGTIFKCEHCSLTFKSIQGYSTHKKTKHASSMPFQCEFCDQVFQTSTAYCQHKSRSHSRKPGQVIDPSIPPQTERQF